MKSANFFLCFCNKDTEDNFVSAFLYFFEKMYNEKLYFQFF